MDEVSNLQLRYSRVRPETIELAIVYVGGRVKVFVVDRFLLKRLLEHLERTPRTNTSNKRTAST